MEKKTTIEATTSRKYLEFQSNSSVAEFIGMTPPFYLWSRDEYGTGGAYFRTFSENGTSWNNYDTRRSDYVKVFCLE